MKSKLRILSCGFVVLTLSTLFILNLPVRREGNVIIPRETLEKVLLILKESSKVGTISVNNRGESKSGSVALKSLLSKLQPPPIVANVLGWSMNTTRNASQYIFVNNFTSNIMPEHICDKPSLLLTVVCSAPGNFEARKAIRETWASKEILQKHNISLYFLVGETDNITTQNDLSVENNQYNDIIQEHFIDSYNNLTLKSIQMVKIASSYCSNTTKYLLKIDDDMFLNVPHLVNLIAERNTTKNFLIGKLICGAKPIKDPGSKWYAPNYMFEGKEYPPYVSGTGYLMSIDVSEKLFETSLSTPIFYLEDVYLTGICARKANIKRQNDNRFTYRLLKDNFCQNMHHITMHRFDPHRMRHTFKMLNDPGVISACESTHSVNTTSWILYNTIKPDRIRRKVKCG